MSQKRGQFLVKSMDENNKIKEIMSRYRPIAPMPPLPPAPTLNDSPTKPCGAFTTLHLRSQPCRVRKRGRPSLASFQAGKRSKPIICPSTSTDAVATATITNSFVPYTTVVPVSSHVIPTAPVSSMMTRSTSFVPYKTQVPVSTHDLTAVPVSSTTTRAQSFVPYETMPVSTCDLPTVPVSSPTTRANSFVPYKTQVPVSTHDLTTVPVSSTRAHSFVPYKTQVPVSTCDLPTVPASSLTTRANSFVPYKTQVPVSTNGLPTVPVSNMTTRAKGFIPYKTQVLGSTHRLRIVPVSGTNAPVKTVETPKDPLTLSLVPYSESALVAAKRNVPVEKDLIKKLMEPKAKAPEETNLKLVIVPRPIRPVDSIVFVGCIVPFVGSLMPGSTYKTPGEVEQDMETETLPTVVSDSQNMVRLANSAYKALIGQPEFLWLETIVKDPCKRINGEVKLEIPESMMPEEATDFTCRVKIEWALNGITNYVCTLCDVRMLYCASRDYVLMWKFRTNEGFFGSCKGWIEDGAVS